MVTDADGFFEIQDMFAWQPIGVCNPNNPTLMVRPDRIANKLSMYCVWLPWLRQAISKWAWGCAKIEQNCQNVSLSCITVLGPLRKSAMFFGGSVQKWGLLDIMLT